MDKTMVIDTDKISTLNAKETLKQIVIDLEDRGYNAYKQITEYLLTGEIGYISSYRECRSKMAELNRRDVVELMLKEFTKWGQ